MTRIKKPAFKFSKVAPRLALLTSFLAFTACGGSDYHPTEILPDDSSMEQDLGTIDKAENVPNSGDFNDVFDAPDFETNPPITVLSENENILKMFSYVDPNRVINQQARNEVLIYFYKNASRIRNKSYVSVIDFSLRSTKARFHIINMNTGAVWSIHTAHGKGSDADHDGYAEKFSNKSGSNASSLGFYLAAETYSGSKGLSLRLDGLSSTNSNARARAVVIHGASYVKESSVIQGRSWGCPAVAMNLRDNVVQSLKGGSLIYAVAK